MDSKTITYALCFILWLVLYSRPIMGEDNCTTFYQVGASVLNGQTQLVCRVTDDSQLFYMHCYINGRLISFTEIDRQRGDVYNRLPCPDRYHCVWNETQSALMVTINKTTTDDGGHWSCNYRGGSGCVNELGLDVNIYEKASTSVRGVIGHPIEGQNYTIYCDITGGRPWTGIVYEWKRDRVVVAETDSMLTIPEVERSMHGSNYTCAADNGAGMGEHGPAFSLDVWYRPSVLASGASHVLEGSTVTLGCYMTDGYPQQVTSVRWMKDESPLSRSGIEGGTIGNPNIIIRNITRDDAGAYRCALSSKCGEGHSDTFHLEVLSEYNLQLAGAARSAVSVVDGSQVLSGVLVLGATIAIASGCFICIVRRAIRKRKKESASRHNSKTDNDLTLRPLATESV